MNLAQHLEEGLLSDQLGVEFVEMLTFQMDEIACFY